MSLKAIIQLNTMRAIEEKAKNTYYQFKRKSNMKPTISHNTDEIKYMSYTMFFSFFFSFFSYLQLGITKVLWSNL